MLSCDCSPNKTQSIQWWKIPIAGTKKFQALQIAADRNPIAADRTEPPGSQKTEAARRLIFLRQTASTISQNKKNCDC